MISRDFVYSSVVTDAYLDAANSSAESILRRCGRRIEHGF